MVWRLMIMVLMDQCLRFDFKSPNVKPSKKFQFRKLYLVYNTKQVKYK